MNTQKLKTVAKKNETAERIMAMVVGRQRNTVYTAFSGLRADLKKKDGKEINRVEFDAIFKELSQLGIGKVDITPRGVYKGFMWSVPIRELGQILKAPETSTEVNLAVAATPIKEAAHSNGSSKKVTLVIIRKNRKPETIESNEEQVAQLSAPLPVALSQ